MWIAILWILAVYLAALGVFALASPVRTLGFLSSFAQTNRAHFIELALRFIAGLAFFNAAVELPGPAASRMIGIMLMVTSLALAPLPGLHRRIARISVNRVAHTLPLLGIGSIGLAVGLAVFLVN